MEEEQSQLIIQLTTAINESLLNHLYSNAAFFAERLIAEKDDEESRNLLAKCFMAENKFFKVFHLLQSCKSDANRYLYAYACLKMNKAKEAEKVLLGMNDKESYSHTFNTSKYDLIPNGSYGVFLLAQAFEKQQKFTEAKEFYSKALDMNPILWIAFEKVCKMGENFLPIKAFSDTKISAFFDGQKNQKKSNVFNSNTRKDYSPVNEELSTEEMIQSYQMPSASFAGKGGSYGVLNAHSNSVPFGLEEIGGGQKKAANMVFGGQGKQNLTNFQSFLNQNANTPLKIPKKGEIHSGRKPLQSGLISNNNSIKDIGTLLKRIGEPFYHMSIYLCKEAIDLFNKLPPNQLRSGWVLMNIGRCLMECTNYTEAEKYFAEAFRIEPWRLEGLEYYSSCLWHLKKSVELSTLAYSSLEKSLLAAESWIAVGNCFSLLKEHETSLKFLHRAIQINPQSAYLHALCGHEYVYNEDFQKAKKCFETALNLDLRNYNAWWGLGNLFFKQEKHEKAADHFRRAISINARLPVLHTYLGMALATKKDFSEALKCFANAELLDPNNVLNRYQKCHTLVQLDQNEEALRELEKLRLLVPKEAPIPLMMGKVYKRLGLIEKAQFHYNLALDLETKDSQRIKGYIENLHIDNSMSEEYEN